MTERRTIAERAAEMTPQRAAALRAQVRERQTKLADERAAKRERRTAKREAGGRLSSTVRREVLAILAAEGAATDDRIHELYEQAVAAGHARPATADFVRRLRSKLLADNLIAPTGAQAPTRAGRAANTWRVVDAQDRPRPSFADAWTRGIHRTDSGVVLVIRCPHCRHLHQVRWDPHSPELTTAACGQGAIRVRITKPIRAQLEAEPDA